MFFMEKYARAFVLKKKKRGINISQKPPKFTM